MPSPYAEFSGLLESLSQIKSKTHQDAQRKAMRAVGVLLRDAIKQSCPVKTTETPKQTMKPGELRDACHILYVRSPNDEQMLAGKHASVRVGWVGNYVGLASAVENGHVNTRKGGAQFGFTPAHPFVRPAWDETKDGAVEVYESVMVEAIRKAMGD